MLSHDLLETLKVMEPDIITFQQFWQDSDYENRFKSLEEISQAPDFWKNPEQTTLSKQLQHVRGLRNSYIYIIRTYNDLKELILLFSEDDQEMSSIQKDITDLQKNMASFKVKLLLQDKHDASNCFLHIHAGAGGTESQDWAQMILRMYTRFCERNNLAFDIIDYQAGEEAGIKSSTLFIKGENPFGMLKSEHGIHRLVRISPFDTNKRRHTSFASVLVTPEMPDIEVSINPNDLRIDTYRASGAGGQHVNKTDSAVRITHLPTNIVVQCQNERSQQQNKAFAMKMLYAKLAQKTREEEEAKKNASIEKKTIEWGSQIRSYVLHPYKMVKDHRTSHESPQPEKVLDGEIADFIEQYLVWKNVP